MSESETGYGIRRLYLTLTLISLLIRSSPGLFRFRVTEITLLCVIAIRITVDARRFLRQGRDRVQDLSPHAELATGG